MAIDNFPVLKGLSFPVIRTANATIGRNQTISGRRTEMPWQSIPRYTWSLPYEFLRSAFWNGLDAGGVPFAELETMMAFFNQRITQGDVFKYQDQEDYIATNQGFGQGDGATTNFQLVRAYGGFVEPVFSGTVTKIQAAGVDVDPANYTVSSKGLVTFTVAPNNGDDLNWTGTFKWYCRFDQNALSFGRFTKGAYETPNPVTFSNEILI